MKQKTIIRKAKNKENPYAQIAKTAVQDKRLSWKATGLLSYILSLPDDWKINLVDLTRRKADGVFATRAALKELATAGYVLIQSYRDEKGRFIGHEHLIYETPQLEECPQSRISHSGILDTTNTDLTKDKPFVSSRVNAKEFFQTQEGIPTSSDTIKTEYH